MTDRNPDPTATCLGCGCACDDIEIAISANRIIRAERACALGEAWFGDGSAPADALVEGQASSAEDALDAAASLLRDARRPLVFVAPDTTCEAQREAVALADVLSATLDSVTSATVMNVILATQERGRAADGRYVDRPGDEDARQRGHLRGPAPEAAGPRRWP